ncbi:hypothetical protein PV05_03283 [Exophiala xenobiotica]|uniref:DUF7924 domain-containing protein n=1 Tax=Exophiala xenobiotica TaxID=348802 RepID=A0A0D2C1Y1_9EURO|nr:uncharacterized protein PV05_03283 [Exophiala xenobiotica]KIW58786.1 hypothetical protein PV05_03283 [Exophiala xenobiotica]
MAADVADRDMRRARRGHNEPDEQLVRPDRSSHKRRLSAKDDEEDEETNHRRKSLRIQEILNKQHQASLHSEKSKPSRTSPRPQEIQDVNKRQTARGGTQTRSSPEPVETQGQRQEVKQYHSPKERNEGQPTASFTNPAAQKSKRPRPVNDGDESNHDAKRLRHCSVQEITSIPQPDQTFDEEHIPRKRPAESTGEDSRKRRRSQVSEIPRSVATWLESLPTSSQEFEDMSQTQSKRPRSPSESSERNLQSDSETDTTVSRSRKYSTYENSRYDAVLESKNSFMYDSKAGPLSEELAFSKTLFARTRPVPSDPAFQEQRLSRFLGLLRGRSELSVCILLHSRLVPSAGYLSLFEPSKFDGLVDGYNESWNQAIIFYEKLPQPDHSVAYRSSVLTDQERRKLDILPNVSSLFTGREGTCFPFFACEVKCGKQALDIADRANTNSMTIALRGVVALYRRAGRAIDVHRRFLGFSIAHDDGNVRIYGHYPEIDGDKTSYYRHRIGVYHVEHQDGMEKWTTDTFVYNLYSKFAPEHIKRIKKVIGELPDPLSQSFGLNNSQPDSQETLSTELRSQLEFPKPEMPQGRFTKARMMLHIQQLSTLSEQRQKELVVQMEQQRKDSEQRQKELLVQMEQQRKDSEQQRKDSEQQRKDSEQRQKELILQLEQQQREERKDLWQMLKQRDEQLAELMKGR